MKTLAKSGRRLGTGLARTYLGALVLALGSPALMAQQCPAGQQLYTTYSPTGLVRVIPVPGSAGGIPSGVVMRAGNLYRMTATGSIRVGVFGETGTPPDGWVPQGSAGNGFPDPDSYTFSLLYRVGPTGQWQLLGSGQATAKLGPHDPAGAQIFFGINDNKLSDNTGFFNVIVTELAPSTKCAVPPPPPPTYIAYGSSSGSSTKTKPTPPALPCAGKTPDGRMQSFQFPLYCGSNFSRNIPIEACTRAEALPQAQAFARSSGPNCYLTSN